MDTKIVYNSYFLNNEDVIDVVRTMVGDPSEWSDLLVGVEKRIYISFDDCVIPLYDFLFSRIGMRFPFCDFRVVVLKYLNVAPSQIHSGSWVFIRVFQICVEYKSWKPSFGLFLDFFHLRHTFQDNFLN